MTVSVANETLPYAVAQGQYFMYPGFYNEQRQWVSKNGNSIWFEIDPNGGSNWVIGNFDKSYFGLYATITDPTKECPNDESLQDQWRYEYYDYESDSSEWILSEPDYIEIKCDWLTLYTVPPGFRFRGRVSYGSYLFLARAG